jgi:hypothetical protein
VLIARHRDLKLASREAGGHREFLEDRPALHFGNRIQEIVDEVDLFLAAPDLRWLLERLDWGLVENPHLVAPLLARFESNYDGGAVRAPFLEALLAAKELAQVGSQQARQHEDRARALEAEELCCAREGAINPAPDGSRPCLDLVDCHRLLGVLVGLEDQLHQIASQSETLTPHARQLLGHGDLSRAHTALGRLSSLLSLPTDHRACPLALAEHGVCNVGDANLPGGLRFYQHLQVDLESTGDGSEGDGRRDIQAALEEQFQSNLMVRGYESWNVPLHRSLNSMPPKSQWSGLRGAPANAPITGLHQLPATDLVLTSSAQEASVNLWATRAGLTRVYGLNFKLQASVDPGDSLQRAQLHFLNYPVEDVGAGVKIYRRDQPADPRPGPAGTPPQAEPEGEKGDGELMQALFDESAALEEACTALRLDAASSHSRTELDDLQAEYELASGERDPDYIEDVFAALEIGEELGRQSQEKAKEAKKPVAPDVKAAEKADKKKPALPLKKGAAKDEKPAAEETPVEPSLELLWQLKDMGFPEDLARRALVKVKNESVAAAVEAAVALQAEPEEGLKLQAAAGQGAAKEGKKATLVEWSCAMCTIINPPGGTTCHICFSPAPAGAYVDERAEKARLEEELQRERDEEARLARERELEEERKRREELAGIEEARRREKVRQEFQKTKAFLESSTTEAFLFGSIN